MNRLARFAIPAARRAGVSAPRAVAIARASAPRFFSADAFLPRDEVVDRVMEVCKNKEKVEVSKLTPEAHFTNDLGLDSLDAVELVMAIEEEFCIEIPDAEADKMLKVSDAVEFVAAHPQAK